jgi:hypothetical protein
VKKASPLKFSKEELEREGVKSQGTEGTSPNKPPGKAQPRTPTNGQEKAGAYQKEKANLTASLPKDGSTPIDKGTSQQKAKRSQARRLFFEDNPDMSLNPVGGKKGMPLPLKAVSAGVHHELDRQEEDNTGLEVAHSTQKSASSTLRFLRQRRDRTRQMKARRSTPAREAKEGAEAVESGNNASRTAGSVKPSQQTTTENPTLSSNPISRWQQKKAIRKQYAAARKAGSQPVTAGATLVDKVKSKFRGSKAFIRRKKRSALLVGGLFAMLLLVMNSLSSCSVLLEGTLTSVASATYPAEDADMKAAEAMYRQMETDLQQELDNYLILHPEYDAVTIDCDKIEHDPYVLISMLSALKNAKPWTIDDVAGLLHTIFDKQYIRTETVTTETRYRTEWQTGIRYVKDPYTGKWVPEYYQYEASIPYLYRTVHVEIENFNLSHLPVYLMSRQQMGLYAMYMSQLGNRPDLFPGSPYIHKYLVAEYPEYEPPAEDLQDPVFAAIFEEASKYLGYPYVWGGASPATSFDCSGFVSWVLNQCGWNIGRLGSQGLYDRSTVITAEEVRPGDLIFFTKTFEANNDVTHVGIMVNQNTMIHCGDPIQFTPTDDAYHIEHFYAFGRIPR